ncbi:MFS transporter [Thalassobaculum sp.]|uniref:MFS transporter n=1 Tax=Thalassobaculum sp. TaxID=2022740 RepID=UPI0032F067E7
MTPSTSARLALGFSCVGHSFAHLLMLLYPTVVLSLEVAWNRPFEELIALMLVGQVLFGVGAVPAGWLGDRWSAPGMMTVFFLGTGAAAIATGFAEGPFEIALGLAAIGLFASIYHPVGIAWVTRNPVNRGRALGINGIFGSAGTAGGAVVAGGLATAYGWQWAFFVPGALCVGAGLVLLALLVGGRVGDTKDRGRSAPSESSRGDMMRGGLILLITIACSGLIYQTTSFAMPKLFEQRLGGLVDTAAGVGAMVSTVYFISAGAQVLGGWLADRYDLRRVYFGCWLLQIPILGLAVTLAGPVLIPVATLMVLINTTAVPAENSLFARYTPPAWRGTAFGVKFLVSLGVAAVSVPLVGEMYRAFHEFGPLLVTLAVAAAVGAIVALLLPATRHAPATQPAE